MQLLQHTHLQLNTIYSKKDSIDCRWKIIKIDKRQIKIAETQQTMANLETPFPKSIESDPVLVLQYVYTCIHYLRMSEAVFFEVKSS